MADIDVPDACPAVKVWWPNMTTEEAHDAKDEAQQEAINILSTIGLDLQPPEKDGGSFQVLQLVDDTDFAAAILEEGETTVRFDNLDGSKGIVIYAAAVNTTLEVTTPGKNGAVVAKRNKLLDKQFPTSDDVANFKIGESFCGAGYFTDPLNDKDAHKTDAARLFLAPLGALAITLHFHPEQTQVCLGGERKFPEIIYYRVDGIFPTSFGASWQTLKYWKREGKKGEDKKNLHDGQNQCILPNNAMQLYPLRLNNALYAKFLEQVPESWTHFRELAPPFADVQIQAYMSFTQSVWNMVFKQQLPNAKKYDEGEQELTHLPITTWDVKMTPRNIDHGFRFVEANKMKNPMKFYSGGGGEQFDDASWAAAWVAETLSLNVTETNGVVVNWDALASVLEEEEKQAKDEEKQAKRNTGVKRVRLVSHDEEGGNDDIADPKKPKGDDKPKFLLGMFNPSHKSRNDKALGKMIEDKFVQMKGTKEVDPKQWELLVEDFLKNHKDALGTTVKRHMKKLFSEPGLFFLPGFEDKVNKLKEKIEKELPGFLGEASDTPTPIKAPKPQLAPRKRDNKKDAPHPEEEVPNELPVPGGCKIVSAKEVIDKLFRAWEPTMEKKIQDGAAKAIMKDVRDGMETVADGVIAKAKVPAEVLAKGRAGGDASTVKTKELVKEVMAEQYEMNKELEKERARVACLRQLVVAYMTEENDMRYLLGMMKRTGPHGQLFSNEELEEDARTSYHVSVDKIEKILKDMQITAP